MPAADVKILIDTGPIVASLSERDPHHKECAEAFSKLPPHALTCWPVVTEAVYLLGDWSPGTSAVFSLLRSGALRVLNLGPVDLDGIEVILSKYRDQGFQLADACLMHLADREGIYQVLTLDKKDFGLYRTRIGKELVLLP